MGESTVEKLDTATRGHHPDSPSSLQSSEACPAFLNENRESQASADGTLQHRATETRNLSILDGDESMEWAVQKAIDYEDKVVGAFRLAGKPFEIVREKYLHVGDEKVRDAEGHEFAGITGGFPDLEIVAEKHAAIIDQKFGKIPVTPTKDNLQAIAYVLGRFEKSPSVQTIEFHFHAPYQKWDVETQRLKYVYTFRRDEIPKLELRIRTVIALKQRAYAEVAQDNWGLAKPKHDLCLWCARKANCHKVQALVIQAVEKHEDLVVPDEVKHYRLSRTDQVASAYRFANQLQTICEAIKKRCVDVSVTEDLKPEGFSIVKMTKRATKSVKAFLDVAEGRGIPKEQALELLTVPIGEFEKLVKAKAAKGQGAATIRAFAAELAENGATELGKPFYFLREARSPAEKEANQVIDV